MYNSRSKVIVLGCVLSMYLIMGYGIKDYIVINTCMSQLTTHGMLLLSLITFAHRLIEHPKQQNIVPTVCSPSLT